jgi:hypothetical protein
MKTSRNERSESGTPQRIMWDSRLPDSKREDNALQPDAEGERDAYGTVAGQKRDTDGTVRVTR